MVGVVPLRYGTAFKKAFSDPEVFSAFAGDILGIPLHFSKVEQEKAFSPPVGKVDVRFDLYGEDEENRVIVELQHVREQDAFSRFHYYHLISQIQQVASSKDYSINRTVYTIVVLTRLPNEEHLRFDMASQSSDLVTHDGRPLGLFHHPIVFVNPRAASPSTPAAVRTWLDLFEDSLDQQIDESAFPAPVFQKVIDTIQESHLSPADLYRLKEEAMWEDSKNTSFREGETKGFARGLRQAIADLCEVLGIEIDPTRRAHLERLDEGELDALRDTLKRSKRWP
ncbi:MAG: hypothetical protein R3B70_40935 [Polyangiaceae bacterium]